jgi:hypothetical protein
MRYSAIGEVHRSDLWTTGKPATEYLANISLVSPTAHIVVLQIRLWCVCGSLTIWFNAARLDRSRFGVLSAAQAVEVVCLQKDGTMKTQTTQT